MPSLGELTIALGAVTTRFREDLDQSKDTLKSTATAMRDVVGTVAKLGIAAGVAGAAIVAGLVKSGLAAIDTQAKTARSINATIDGLRGLQLAAGDFGVEQEELNGAMEKFTQKLGAAQRQGGPVADMLQDLGLNAADLMKLDVDERMAVISDRVKALGLSTEQTADMLRQFGIRSSEMIDLMRQGGDTIRGFRKDVDAFGISLSAIDARKVEAANDSMERIGLVMEGVRNKLTVAIAPILQVIADRFNDAAKANGGWGDVAQRVITTAIRGFGKVLDVVHGIRVAFKAAELVLMGFNAVVNSVVQIAANVFAMFVDGVIGQVNIIIDALNRIPNVDIAKVDPFSESAFMKGLNIMAENSRNKVGEIRSELHELAMQEMPSEKFERFLADVAAKSQEAAEGLERVQAGLGTGEGAEGFGVDTSAAEEEEKKEKAKLEALREAMAEKVQIMAEGLLSEEELIQLHYERDLELLREAEEAKLYTEEEFQILRQSMEEDHMEKLKSIREKGMTDMERFMSMSFARQAQTVVAGIASMTASLSSGSKTMFDINKAAGIASASVSMFQGIAAGLKLGWPMAIPAVAYAAAVGASQIAAIKSQQFGGGGGASATIGASSSVPTTSSGDSGGGSASGGGQTVTIQGLDPNSLFSGRQVVDLLNSAVKDGARLVLE